MYKQLTALALCTAAACFATGAHAEVHDVTGWFVNGSAGSAHYKASFEDIGLGKNSDTGFQFNAGWRSQFVGIEGGYTDLGGVTLRDDVGDKLRVDGKGWTLGLNAHINPVGKWYIAARAGFFFWTVDGHLTLADGEGGSARFSDSEHGTNGYAGLGTGIDFDRHWSLGVGFDYYKVNKYHVNIDSKLYSATLEYRF